MHLLGKPYAAAYAVASSRPSASSCAVDLAASESDDLLLVVNSQRIVSHREIG